MYSTKETQDASKLSLQKFKKFSMNKMQAPLMHYQKIHCLNKPVTVI